MLSPATPFRPAALLRLLPALLLALTLTACADDEADPMMDESAMEEMNEEIGATEGAGAMDGAARMEQGVQVVEVEVGREGYRPQQIRLEAGVPARLVFTRTLEGECPSQVQLPAFDVEPTDLPMHEPVAVEFTPDESGTFTFTCGMEMMEGTLVVRS